MGMGMEPPAPPPPLEIFSGTNSPAGGNAVSHTTPTTFTATATASLSATGIDIAINNGATQIISTAYTDAGDIRTFTVMWMFSGVKGIKTLTFRAKDSAGNLSVSNIQYPVIINNA